MLVFQDRSQDTKSTLCCFVKLTDGNSNMTTVYKGSQFNLNSIAFKQDDAQMHVNMEYSFSFAVN